MTNGTERSSCHFLQRGLGAGRAQEKGSGSQRPPATCPDMTQSPGQATRCWRAEHHGPCPGTGRAAIEDTRVFGRSLSPHLKNTAWVHGGRAGPWPPSIDLRIYKMKSP